MLTHRFRSSQIAAIAAVASMLGATMSYTSDADPGADVNFVPLRNVYPGGDGGSLATLGASSSPDGMGVSGDVPDMERGPAVDTPDTSTGGLQWWIGIAVVIGLMMFAAKKTGSGDEFKNLRASTYNIALITLIAVVGLTFLKIVAVKVKKFPVLSGFSQVVMAA